MAMNAARFAALACVVLPLMSGCGVAVYRAPGSASLDLHPDAEINDEDVKKAFDAKPQMPNSFRVAYFSLDPTKSDDIDRMIRSVPGVTDAYRIPSLLATGERKMAVPSARFERSSTQPLSIKKLRVLAAKAQADVLLLFDYGNRVEEEPNGWVATGVLLVPLLFVPFLETTTESYFDSYMIDTRNGFVYAEVSAQEKAKSESHSLYTRPEQRELPKQWNQLLDSTRKMLTEVAE
ncbi:MAG: hypothetical protein U0165_19045 [Polyangiaceae bacterium]